MKTPSLFNPDGSLDQEMLDIAARAGFQESDKQEMEKALTLSAAGWKPEIQPHHTPHPFTGNVAVMSWYWRRPPLGKSSKGKLFLSTNQAFNALKKST